MHSLDKARWATAEDTQSAALAMVAAAPAAAVVVDSPAMIRSLVLAIVVVEPAMEELEQILYWAYPVAGTAAGKVLAMFP